MTTNNWRFLTSFSKDLEQGDCLILAKSTRIRTFLKPHTVQLYFFYMNRPFVQTKTVNPLTETGYFWNRTPEWFRTLSARIRVAKYPASKMLKFSFSIKVFISNDIFNRHYYTYVTRASIIVCFSFFCTILFGLEPHNLRRDNTLKIVCRRLYITTKFYTYHVCHHDCSLQCQNVGL